MSWLGLCESDSIKRMITLTVITLSGAYCTKNPDILFNSIIACSKVKPKWNWDAWELSLKPPKKDNPLRQWFPTTVPGTTNTPDGLLSKGSFTLASSQMRHMIGTFISRSEGYTFDATFCVHRTLWTQRNAVSAWQASNVTNLNNL